MTTWVQCPDTGKFIPKEQYQRVDVNAPAVHGDVKDFVSPITKEVITDRGQLREHMRQHGVTNSADYSESFLKSRSAGRAADMQGTTEKARQERRELISRELTHRGIH